MNEIAPADFSADESVYLKSLGDGAVLVGDRWFPRDSAETERARYLLAYHRKNERNRRRREKYRADKGEPKPRKVRAPIAIDDESQRANRLTLERRKCLRRATVARCPTPNELRTAWRFRHESPKNWLRLGGLLLDLECYVDNALKLQWRQGKWKICGRTKGIRGWIRENCPELERKYKTMMRAKADAKKLRQAVNVADPVPTSLLLQEEPIDFELLKRAELQVQPRGADDGRNCRLVKDRFVWEHSSIKVDANGRLYREDENYWLIPGGKDTFTRFEKQIADIRLRVQRIILNRPEKRTNENYKGAMDNRGVEARRMRKNRRFSKRSERKKRWTEVVGEMLLAWMSFSYDLSHGPWFSLDDLKDEW